MIASAAPAIKTRMRYPLRFPNSVAELSRFFARGSLQRYDIQSPGRRPVDLMQGKGRQGRFRNGQENKANVPGGDCRIGFVGPCVRYGCDVGSSKKKDDPRIQAGPEIRLEADSACPRARTASLGSLLISVFRSGATQPRPTGRSALRNDESAHLTPRRCGPRGRRRGRRRRRGSRTGRSSSGTW